MADRYDLVIVGLGSAGIVAAQFAARLGLRVAAVERDRVGGDCLWTGCVPSKALLASAKAAHTMRHADRYGLKPVAGEIDTTAVWERLRAIQQELADSTDDPQHLVDAGVDVLLGAARVTGPGEVVVDGHGPLRTRYVLLATGSRPAVPGIPGLDDAGALSPETLWDLRRAPASVVVIGGGPIAIELAQALTRLGARVTVLEREARILPREEPELAELLARRLRVEGVEIHTGVSIAVVETTPDGGRTVRGAADGRTGAWTADAILLAAGRSANVEGLGLEALGIDFGPKGVVVDDALRTAAKTVYAAGDVAGRHLFTHSAGFEGARAVRNMFFPRREQRRVVVPWCTFSDPELAHAGMTVAEARAAHGDDVRVWRHDLAGSDRARADSAGAGAIVLVTVKGRLVGAHVLAPAAGELIGELVLAIEQGMKLEDLAGVVHVYPTISTGIQQLAADAAYERATRLRWLTRLAR